MPSLNAILYRFAITINLRILNITCNKTRIYNKRELLFAPPIFVIRTPHVTKNKNKPIKSSHFNSKIIFINHIYLLKYFIITLLKKIFFTDLFTHYDTFGYCDQFDNIYHTVLAFFQQAQMQMDLSSLVTLLLLVMWGVRITIPLLLIIWF